MSARPARPSRPLGFGAKLALAVVVATLLFGRQIASWTTPKNRYLFHWQPSDGLALVLGILALALLFLGLGLALSHSPWVRRRRLSELAFLAAFTHALLAQIQGIAGLHSFWVGVLLWGAILAVIRWLQQREARWPLAFASRVCLVLWPLAPILMFQILSWPAVELDERGAEPVPTRLASGRPPVAVLVFDEWSWQRSNQDGLVRPRLPHMRALAGRSLLVQNAVSPGDWTWISLPSMLFGSAGELEVRRDGVDWVAPDGAARPTRDVPSLLDMAERHGYRSQLLGYYFPYRDLLGTEGDVVRSYVKYAKGDGLVGAVALAFGRNLEFWSDPISQALWEPFDARSSSGNWRKLTESTRSDLRRELSALQDGTFFFAHLPMPHSPFVFDRDGNYLGPYGGERSEGTPEQYEEQMLFADRILGEAMRALEESGRFDRALVVVTSDHSWRHDPEAAPGDALADRRVPLLIKWPGQRDAFITSEPFCTLRLAPLIEAAMASDAPEPLTGASWPRLAAAGLAACAGS